MTQRKIRDGVPLQVYLTPDEQQRLEGLADHLGTNKSDVVRRGLLALERELHDPAAHPALRLIGIADSERSGATVADAAREHDRLLAESEEEGWGAASPSASRRQVAESTAAARKRRGR